MITSKPTNLNVTVDLTGPEGNAFVLMGYAKNWAKQLGLDYGEIQAEMMGGDYDHLLETLDKHFGEYVTFYK